jgi:hypothetical protein
MAQIVSSEVKLFSQATQPNSNWMRALQKSSSSKKTAQIRQKIYSDVFTRYNGWKELAKQFTGYTEIPILSNQYFNATMSSYVRSFAGFLAIERDQDQPTVLLYYADTLGVTDNRIVLPNIGKENLNNINARFKTSAPLSASSAAQSITTGKKLIPGTVVLRLVHAADPANFVEIKDDRKGNLLAPAGVLSVGYVDYTAAGKIEFTINTDNWQIAAGDSFSLIAYEDVPGTPDWNGTAPANNRFKLDQKHIEVTAEPDMLTIESNLMNMATMQKALGVNPQDLGGAKLVEIYTKLINQKLVHCITDNYEGNVVDFDISGDVEHFLDYDSGLKSFAGRLVDVDTALAKKSVKGCFATAYLVGTKTADYFRKLKQIGAFVDNTDSTYINDLVGYYNGIPVLRHTDIEENAGYAIHKTADGQLAPCIRGIYLPLTNTPTIGNYQNPVQIAQSVYYQESNEIIVPELVTKFQVV